MWSHHSWDGVLTVSSPALQTRCLAAGLSDSSSLQPSGVLRMGREGGRIPPTQAGLWEMVVPDKKAWKLLRTLDFWVQGGGVGAAGGGGVHGGSFGQ